MAGNGIEKVLKVIAVVPDTTDTASEIIGNAEIVIATFPNLWKQPVADLPVLW